MIEGIVNQTVPITSLFPHPRNYRSHPEEQIQHLCASYRRFGQFRSIVVVPDQKEGYLIVAGHGFVEAMKREHATQIRVEILPPDTTNETIDGILLADNLHSQYAEDDSELIALLLQEQQNAGFDLESIGSDNEALRQMIAAVGSDTQEDIPVFKEYDETITDDLDTELCEQCGKLCVKPGAKT